MVPTTPYLLAIVLCACALSIVRPSDSRMMEFHSVREQTVLSGEENSQEGSEVSIPSAGQPDASTSTPADTTLPTFRLLPLCGYTWVEVAIADSAANDSGIQSIEIDPADSSNVLYAPDPSFTPGARTARVRLRLADTLSTPSSGFARLVVEDGAGNVARIDVTLGKVLPILPTSTISLVDVHRSELRRENVEIVNGPARVPIVLESCRLLSGNRFQIQGYGNSGSPNQRIIPGDTFRLGLNFSSGIRGTFTDTLLLTIDCHDYRIPLRAVLGEPHILLQNIDYWQVLRGDEKCEMLAAANVGTDTLEISAIEVGGEYRFDTLALPDLPIRLAPGSALMVPVCFVPRRLGLLLGKVTFLSSTVGGDTTIAQLVGIGVNTLTSAAFDNEGSEIQISVVPQARSLTIVSAERGRKLTSFQLYNTKGEEIILENVQLIGEGWWQIDLKQRLTGGFYILRAVEPGIRTITAKFVNLE